MRLIASGERPSCFAASSSDVEDLASSMSRRSSLNDQGFRAITEKFLSHRHNDKAAKRTHVSLGGFAWVGPGLGEPGAKMDMRLEKARNKQPELS
jgi:hypothetical protein